MKKTFTSFIIIFTTLLGIAGFWYYYRNIYSKEILKLEILGPTEVELAEEIGYIVKYKNNGNIRLEEPRLIFEYPKYSLIEEGKREREEISLEDIYPGEEKTFTFKARLLGKENEAKVAKAWLSYRPKNLKGRFESTTTFTTQIKYTPLTFELDFPSKVKPGEKTYFRINYFSNVDYPLTNLRVKIEYPSGFEFREAKPKPLEKTEWEIPLLNKAEGGRIEIYGVLTGEIQESKIFRAQLGIWKEGEFVLLKEAVKGVEIARPPIFIFAQINGSPQYITSPGDYLHYEISFKNTEEKVLENLFLIVQLEGEGILDFETLQPGSGFFQKETKRIIWDHTLVPELKFLEGMGEGKVDFWVRVKKDLPSQNSTIRAKIILSQVEEEIVTKVNTKLVVSQKGYFHQGPFKNSGPLPPQVGKETRYTLFWQVKNFYNEVKNLKVKTTLPHYVNLSGEISLREARFSFDNSSREIVWEVGDLPARGNSEIFFQVILTPPPALRGETPELIYQAKVIATDSWTGAVIETTAPAVNTTLPDDPLVTKEQGIVQ